MSPKDKSVIRGCQMFPFCLSNIKVRIHWNGSWEMNLFHLGNFTCLNFYDKKDDFKAGNEREKRTESNMLDALQAELVS